MGGWWRPHKTWAAATAEVVMRGRDIAESPSLSGGIVVIIAPFSVFRSAVIFQRGNRAEKKWVFGDYFITFTLILARNMLVPKNKFYGAFGAERKKARVPR